MMIETVKTVDLSDHATLMDCYTKLNVAFRKQKERIAELEAESKARLTDASTAWDLCETLRARIAELEAENRALRNEYKAVNQELTEMQGKYETARAALGEKE